MPGFAARTPFATGIRRTLAWFETDPTRQQVDAAMNLRRDKLIAACERGLAQARTAFGAERPED